MTQRLAGKVALITGGASGIGAAHVRVFAQAGARVVAGDVQDKLGEAVVESARAAGGDAVFVHLDVTSPEDWARAVATAIERCGRLTTLVNNAGIFTPGASRRRRWPAGRR